jgi:4-coumarate--CoA ligase
MMGYKDNPAATAECLSDDGWLRTGDIAYYDTDGFFFITDRKKEMMKVRGFPVFPAELEGLLVTHEHIQDVAVIPKLCDTSGEVPKAYIVLKPNINLKEEEILSWVKERVSPHKRLAGGITFTHEIPKSPSGKILRRVLRNLDRAAPKSN